MVQEMLKKNVTQKDNAPYKQLIKFSFLNTITPSSMEIVFETYYKMSDRENTASALKKR